jgi:hypothetical protein
VRNSDERITRDLLSGEALYILKNLKDNKGNGRANKLAEVKANLEPTVTLEFDNYFFFLRKYNYIAMDREACLQLTGDGERVLEGTLRDRFTETVGEYFASRLGEESSGRDDAPAPATARPMSRPPPPPPPPGPGFSPTPTGTPTVEPIRLTADAVMAEADNEPEQVMEQAQPEPLPPPPPPPPVATSAKRPATRRGPTPAPEPELPPMAQPPRSTEVPRAPEPRSAAPSGNTELEGRYTKGDLLGTGPLGQVYRGKHLSTGVDLAIKELKDIFGYFSFLQRTEVIKRLRKELQGQAQVRHPSVVQVLDLSLDTARPFFVLELCTGGSLREEMEESENKGLKVEQAIRYFLQICYGLKAAHTQGLTHLNLKPENVLIDQAGNAKLGDFGLTRVIEVDSVKGMPQVFVGTGGMGYLPPELMARQKSITASADVYSLGILFYEMLTGMLPGRRSPLPSQLRKDIPEKLDAIFDRMTQDRKDDRLPDIDAVLNEFYAAFTGNEWLKKGDLVLWSESGGNHKPAQAEPAPAGS